MHIRTQPALGHIAFMFHHADWVRSHSDREAREHAQRLLACTVEVGSADYYDRLLVLRYHTACGR